MERHPTAVFHEVQHVRQAWFGYVLLVAGVSMVAFMSWGMYRQLVAGQPFGDQPMSDTMLAVLGTLYLAIGAGMLYLFFVGKLVTEVRPDGIYARWAPFHREAKRFVYEDIAEYEARKYSPIFEYGGWGLRYSRKGGAYNVHGNRGVQLVFTNGKRLMIGSQRADTMVNAIHSVR